MVRQIVIVGGGTAGWMTAAYLRKTLDPACDITVVESGTIRTIGVGEATFSTIKLFFDWLDLDETEWMPACNATYKMAIRFVDWTSVGGHFYHPFQRYEMVDGVNLGEWWLKLKSGFEPSDYACFTVPALCDHLRSPRFLDGRVFDDQVQTCFTAEHRARKGVLADHLVQYPYAYHFDASLLADFLKNYAMHRGVRQVIDDVVEVRRRADADADDGGCGDIAAVVTREHGAVGGDLFVDCTGFRGLLINQTLGEPFIPFSRALLCDSAIAMQVPDDIAAHGIEPFTTATALTSGWVWRIPLYGRIGTGYVYSSAFAGADEAEEELRRHLGPPADGCAAARLRMRIGRCRNSWVRNCVAIGLASGFVEPLESTGIFFIQHGIETLVDHLHAPPDEEMVRSYNRSVAECIDGVMEFLTLHYCASDRRDTPFWRAASSEIEVPEALAERLRLWRRRLPNRRNVNSAYHGFEAYSYSVMLLGLSGPLDASLPVLDLLSPRNALAAFDRVRARAAQLVETLPSQYEYLTHARAVGGPGRLVREPRDPAAAQEASAPAAPARRSSAASAA
ncbi:MAG TPA: tryptophan halogenase family protein [Thermoanaerobaculia bacterium]|jgi:tryptophan halogenase|nr:tryptophan halogenase family protein [Thermoanaerobaculia bacterium]